MLHKEQKDLMTIGDCVVTTENLDTLLSGIKVDCPVSCQVILLHVSPYIQREKRTQTKDLSDRMKLRYFPRDAMKA